jgi:hypothetical protein
MLSLVAAWLVNIAHFLKLNKSSDGVERFRAKVRVKKTRQIKNREPRFVSIETEKAPAARIARQRNAAGNVTVLRSLCREPGPDRLKHLVRWRLVTRGGLEFAVDAQANATHRQQADPGFGPAGLDLIADPEPPLPDPRRRRGHDYVFHAPVIQIHGISPNAIRWYEIRM